MKRGFTLIELLAVIVILAIIALIAVPIVLNIINESKESSLLRSAEFYLDAVEYTVADAFLYHGGLSNGSYPITPNGDICKENENPCTEENILKVEVNGDKPTGGTITINGGDISNVEIIFDEKQIVKNIKGELIYRVKLNDVCTLVSGTSKTIGAKYECDFGGGVKKFYILDIGTNRTNPNLKEDEVALILEGNYDTTTQHWCDPNGPFPNDNKCEADGLTTKLDEIATTWTKLERSQIVLPSSEQIMVADGKSLDSLFVSLSNGWLYKWEDNPNYVIGNWPDAYWTSTPYAEDSGAVHIVYANGYVSLSNPNTEIYGVRPVVNIKL